MSPIFNIALNAGFNDKLKTLDLLTKTLPSLHLLVQSQQ